MWISGLHSVESYLKHKPEWVKVIHLLKGHAHVKQVEHSAKQQGISIQWHQKAPGDKRRQLGQGVGAECVAFEYADIGDLPDLLTPNGTVLVLDSIQDPNNLGACIRSADATQVDCIIIPKDKSAPITGTVVKAATGATATVPIVRVTNLVRAIEKLKSLNVWVYGTALTEQSQSLYECDFRHGATALVLGSEGDGMRRLVQEACDYTVMIPMQGTVQSLNVSVATGVGLFEITRQKARSCP